MAICPFAVQKLIKPGPNDPPITPRLAILHVADSGSVSLWDFFAHRSGGIEAHFYITWTGRIEQYRDTDWQADANYLANDFAVSIESQGFAGGTWNKRQLAAIERLLVWLHETHPIPLRPAKAWDGHGVGYHTMFGAPSAWTPVAKSCPGVKRKVQFEDVLVPWMKEQAVPTPVQVFRAAVRAALESVDLLPDSKVKAHAMAEAIRTALREGPKR